MKPPQRRAGQAPQWDSVESDTESLAQERAYQQQLQTRISHQDPNRYVLPQRENAGVLQQRGGGEDEDVNQDENESRSVYDSLEVAAHTHIKANPTLLQAEYLDTQRDERVVGMNQLPSDDAYSDLRYDPNWRTNLKGAGCFDESPPSAVQEYYQIPTEKSGPLRGDRQELVIKGGYRYITDTSPAVVVTPHTASDDWDQPYRLHPQDGQNGFAAPRQSHSQLRSPQAALSRPSGISMSNKNDTTSEDISKSPELRDQLEDIHAIYVQEYHTYYQQELGGTQGGHIQVPNTTTPKGPKVLPYKKLERVTEDIVERNKATLGRHRSKHGSYAQAHALKQETPQTVNKVHLALKETTTAETQEEGSDPELRWLQKTQQLRVTQISKEKKAQRKENTGPSRQQKPPAPGVKAVQGDCLSSPLAGAAAATQPQPQTASLQPPLPTIHLNINLNTSSQLLPFDQQKAHDAIVTLASLHGPPCWRPKVQLTSSPVHQQRITGKSPHIFQEELHNSPEQWKSTVPALSWPYSCEGEDQKWSPQNLPRTPTSTWSQDSGSYTVLPPIGQPMMEKKTNLCPGQSVNLTHPVPGGYLLQMEKQKQLRTKVTYKAYTLKDYKQLTPDVTLRGLGPDYTAIEKTKMKQQKLYSEVIREQNKKISRIPFRPAKDPEGNDKKVPRMKALEYAKTIAKPPVPSQPKLKLNHQSAGFMQGSNMSQLATLELLRKRHEEEKQAVALFRKVHAV